MRGGQMNTIGDILNAKEIKLDKCKKCGKEYRIHEQIIFKGTERERVLRVQVPTCNCEELEREREKAAKEAARNKELLAKKFENSLMTPYFKQKTFSNLQEKAAEYGNEKELKRLQKYAQDFNKEDHKGIFLIGKPGTGKTTMLAAVCNDLLGRGYNCLFITMSALMEKFTKYSFDNNGDILGLLMWLVKFDFIVIDDIGRENYTDRRKEIAFRIVDTILNYQVTAAFTANPESIARLSKIDEWGAVLDRLKDICAMQIKFSGESLRGRAW